MIAVFLQTLPFFALIGLGYWAGQSGFFGPQATAALTRFVFFFPLSAMLFRFAAGLSLDEILDWQLIGAYLAACVVLYLLASAVALIRGRGMQEAAVEAQCAIVGNLGFLGIPLLPLLLGEAAIGPLLIVISVDLLVFSSLIVVIITGARDGRMSPAVLATVWSGLIRNPMVVSILAGLVWSALDLPIPAPAWEFLTILGAAATPGALFAIGASLAGKSPERLSVAAWLTFCKLALHPVFVAVSVFLIFPVTPYSAAVAVAAAALPVAGNVYMLAQHYGVAPQRVSASILLSTILSIVTIPAAIAWLGTG